MKDRERERQSERQRDRKRETVRVGDMWRDKTLIRPFIGYK